MFQEFWVINLEFSSPGSRFRTVVAETVCRDLDPASRGPSADICRCQERPSLILDLLPALGNCRRYLPGRGACSQDLGDVLSTVHVVLLSWMTAVPHNSIMQVCIRCDLEDRQHVRSPLH